MKAAWLRFKLKFGAYPTRIQAAKDLQKFNDPRTLKALVLALDDRDTAREAARALCAIGNPMAFGPLLRLASRNASGSTEAVRALGAIGGTDAVQGLISLLSSEEEEVVLAAIHCLSPLRESDALEPLLLVLERSSDKVRVAASEALAGLGWTPTAAQRIAIAISDRNYYRAAAEGAIAIRPLIAVYPGGSGTPLVRDKAEMILAGLCKIQSQDAVLIFKELLKDPSDSVRVVAITALTSVREEDITANEIRFKAIIEAFDDPEEEVRSVAISAVQTIREPEAIHSLVKLLNHASRKTRTRVAHVLQEVGWNPTNADEDFAHALAWEDFTAFLQTGPEAVERTLQFLHNHECETELVRRLGRCPICCAIHEGVASIQTAKAVKPLISALSDDSTYQIAATALLNIGTPEAVDAVLAADNYDAIRVSEKFIANQEPRFSQLPPRQRASLAVKARKYDRAITESETVIPMLVGRAADLVVFGALKRLTRLTDVSIIPALEVWLERNDRDRDLRIVAANLLGKFSCPEAFAAQTKCLKDRNPSVRRATAESMKAIALRPADTEARVLMALALHDWGEIKLDGEASVEPLIAALDFIENQDAISKSHNFEFLGEIATTLGEIGDKRSVHALVKLVGRHFDYCLGPQFGHLEWDFIREVTTALLALESSEGVVF